MVLYRPVRGYLDKAMKEVKELNSWEELIYILPEYSRGEEITLKKGNYDERIGWDTWYVLANGQCCGFLNGELKKKPIDFEDRCEWLGEH